MNAQYSSNDLVLALYPISLSLKLSITRHVATTHVSKNNRKLINVISLPLDVLTICTIRCL